MKLTQSQNVVREYPISKGEVLKVVAGPGTGKSLTLVHKILYLVENAIAAPEEILVLSMSNRSVNSLKALLRAELKEDCQDFHIFTFHAFCSLLIDKYASYFDEAMKKSIIFDDISWKSFCQLISKNTLQLNGRGHYGSISTKVLDNILVGISNGDLTMETAAQKYNIGQYYIEALVTYLKSNGIIRYNDLLNNALDLLWMSSKLNKGTEPITLEMVNKYKVVIVDEYQDIYTKLNDVIRAVIHHGSEDTTMHKHLVLAGDSNQGIYGFLGTHHNSINDTEELFSKSRITLKHLYETFRLTPEIASLANELSNSSPKSSLIPQKDCLHLPITCHFHSKNDWYEFIANEVVRLICESGGLLKPSDFAILTRSNRELEAICNFFEEKYDLGCNRLSSVPSWANSECYILLVMLYLVGQNSGLDFAVIELLSKLDTNRGAKRRMMKLFSLSQLIHKESKNDFLEYFFKSIESSVVSDSTDIFIDMKKLPPDISSIYHGSDKAEILLRIYKTLKVIIDFRLLFVNPECQSLQNITKYLHTLFAESGMFHTYYKKGENQKVQKEGIQKSVDGFYIALDFAFEKYSKKRAEDRGDFLVYFIKNYSESITISSEEKLNVSTIHSAKGLEFPIVFFESVTDRNLSDRFDLESNENSRIQYVAITRTECLLYIRPTKGLLHLQHCTSSLPKIGTNPAGKNILLNKIAKNLHREVPPLEKIIRGQELFKKLRESGQISNKIPIRNYTTHVNYSARTIGVTGIRALLSLGRKL